MFCLATQLCPQLACKLDSAALAHSRSHTKTDFHRKASSLISCNSTTHCGILEPNSGYWRTLFAENFAPPQL